MTRAWACVLLLAAACDSSAPDGSGLVIEPLDQSATAEPDVLLALHARGGNSIYAAVEGGTFLSASDGQPPTATTAMCLRGTAADPLFTVEIAVTPSQANALLASTLYQGKDCTGPAVQSRLSRIAKPTITQVIDAGVDGGTP